MGKILKHIIWNLLLFQRICAFLYELLEIRRRMFEIFPTKNMTHMDNYYVFIWGRG